MVIGNAVVAAVVVEVVAVDFTVAGAAAAAEVTPVLHPIYPIGFRIRRVPCRLNLGHTHLKDNRSNHRGATRPQIMRLLNSRRRLIRFPETPIPMCDQYHKQAKDKLPRTVFFLGCDRMNCLFDMKTKTSEHN